MTYFVLAHGALGIWDEVIFLCVAIIFMVFMGMSWARSRALPPNLDDTPTQAPSAEQSDTHFRLD